MESIRVLLVDDIARVRVALRSLFQFEPGFEVVGEAGDGEQALTLARAVDPDLILMDLSLPKLDGLEAIRRLRAEGASARVVVLTLYGEMRAAAHAAGADLFLEKGVEPEKLLSSLQECAAKRVPRPLSFE